MKQIVVNEWFLEYGKEDTPIENIEIAKDFFRIFMSNPLQIVVIEGDEFVRKLYKYEKKSLGQTSYKFEYYRDIKKHILLNSRKCVLNDFDVKVKLDNHTEYLLRANEEEGKINNIESDRFLFNSASLIEGNEKLILTTDDKLIKRFAKQSTYKVQHIKDFINEHKNTK